MKHSEIHINFELLAKALRQYVRQKAIVSGSTIIYLKDDQIIEENPNSLEKKVIKKLSPKAL